jgi:simple sugar transport system permease protein
VRRSQLPALAALGLFVLLYGAACVKFPGFRGFDVFLNLLRDNAFLGVAAVGLTFVIISGGIDLSVGSMVALISTAAAWMIGHRTHPILAIASCLVFGLLFGWGQGALITTFKLPPFLVTLGGMLMARGCSYLISTESAAIDNPFFAEIAKSKVLGPIVFLLLVGAAWFVLTQRPFGRTLFAIGGAEASAELMGLPVAKSKRQVYAIGGLCSALAGVLYTLYTSSGDATAGIGLELDAITAVVIGGTLLTGGVGSVLGTLVGLLIFGTIQQVIIFDGTLSSWWTKIVIGGLLAVFLILQKLVEKGLDLKRSET